jgi:large subunit ribosomal protein L21
MKKAVFTIGGKQYLVSEGQVLEIELVKDMGRDNNKQIELQPLLVINDTSTLIGKPILSDHKITAEIVQSDLQSDKVTSIRYKSKKRVHKIHGHRQHQSQIKIISIE